MDKKTKEVSISTEYITLGQVLKISNVIASGGQAKEYLKTAVVSVNGVSDNRRGRKLYPEDKIVCNGLEITIKAHAD